MKKCTGDRKVQDEDFGEDFAGTWTLREHSKRGAKNIGADRRGRRNISPFEKEKG